MKNKVKVPLIIVLVILAAIYLSDLDLLKGNPKNNVSTDFMKANIENYFKTQNVESYEIVNIDQYNDGLFMVNLKVNGNAFESYITADGKKLFGAEIPLDAIAAAAQAGDTSQPPANVEKRDKLSVELVVMSHCRLPPYENSYTYCIHL